MRMRFYRLIMGLVFYGIDRLQFYYLFQSIYIKKNPLKKNRPAGSNHVLREMINTKFNLPGLIYKIIRQF
jgi:hypothetical protein